MTQSTFGTVNNCSSGLSFRSSLDHMQVRTLSYRSRFSQEETMKLKFALVGLAALGSLAAAGTASAMPTATPDALGGSDGAVIQVKGGHGHGHMGRGGRGHHYGWGRGRGHHYGWRH